MATAVRSRLEAEAVDSGYSPSNQGANLRTQNGMRRRGSRSLVAVAAAALAVGVLIGVNLVGVGDDGPRPGRGREPARTGGRGPGPGRRATGRAPPHRAGLEPGGARAAVHRLARLPGAGVPGPALEDVSTYPSGAWRPNDVDLRTDGATWVATGVPDCPSVAQPGCSSAPRERTVSGRPPFADDAPVPLELVVPVRSFSDRDTAEVVGEGTVAGRRTVEVTVAAAQVGPPPRGAGSGRQPAGGPPHRPGRVVVGRRRHGSLAAPGARVGRPWAPGLGRPTGVRRPAGPGDHRHGGHRPAPGRAAGRWLHPARRGPLPATPGSAPARPAWTSSRSRPKGSPSVGSGASTARPRPPCGPGPTGGRGSDCRPPTPGLGGRLFGDARSAGAAGSAGRR